MGKTYYCGVCDEKMKTDLGKDEGELREHYRRKHKQFKVKKNAENKEITIEVEPSGMTMYNVLGPDGEF